MTRYRTVLLFGAPGSGKGTQGKIIGAMPGYKHLACGDVFRSLDRNSPIGLEFAKYASGGGLVPDSLTVDLWRLTMDNWVDTGMFDPVTQTLLLDGIPRTAEQARLMTDRLDVVSIIHLFVNDVSQIVARLQARAAKENRQDDTDIDIIRHRMDVYEEQTSPVLAMYPSNIVTRVNATQPPGTVTTDIVHALTDRPRPRDAMDEW